MLTVPQTPDALQQAFAAGEAAALDPDNQERVAAGRATTTLRSPWLHLRCDVCSHTFRLGDAVLVDLGGRARHLEPSLGCAEGSAPGEATEAAPEASSFYAALDEAWPPPRDLAVVRLLAGDPLVAGPEAGFRRRTCAVCGHTLRPGDIVVVCPCFPGAPRCQLAIHRDLVRGLHCYDEWALGERKRYCLATSRVFDE